MIKIEDLEEFRPTYRFEDGENVTLQSVKQALKAEAGKQGIPVAFYPEEVKSGGLLSRKIEECTVMYHPDHKYDYFNFCIRVQHQGSLAYVAINVFGKSSQMDKFSRAEFAKEDRKGKDLSYKIGSMIGAGIRNIGMNKQKLEEEMRYYDAIEYLLDHVIA